MRNAKKLLALILAVAVLISGVIISTVMADETDEKDVTIYKSYKGEECNVPSETAQWNADRKADRNGSFDLDYYEKDLFAPATTDLQSGKVYKAIYEFTINHCNVLEWEIKCMPVEEYYFNFTCGQVWSSGSTKVAVVVPFKVTKPEDVKLKLWTHGGLTEKTTLDKIMVVGADYNAWDGEYDVVLEGVANAGSNAETNRPAANEWTPSSKDGKDVTVYKEYKGEECNVPSESAEWNAARKEDRNGSFDLDYYEKDLFAPTTTDLKTGTVYKAIYEFTLNNCAEPSWEIKCMPVEEYYFNFLCSDVWSEGSTKIAVVVPFKVTNPREVKLKLWTHGGLTEKSTLDKIMVVGADYNVWDGDYDVVLESVANSGNNVETNKPDDNEWTPSVKLGFNASFYQHYGTISVDGNALGAFIPSSGNNASCSYENNEHFDASIEEIMENVKLLGTKEVTSFEDSYGKANLEGLPEYAGDNDYLVKWEGTVTAETTGTYTLIGRKIDNGCAIFVDGEKVYEYWGNAHWFDGAEDRLPSKYTFELTAGEAKDIEIYFLELGGGEALSFDVQIDSENATALSDSGLAFDLTASYYQAMGYSTDWGKFNDIIVNGTKGNSGTLEGNQNYDSSIDALMDYVELVGKTKVSTFEIGNNGYDFKGTASEIGCRGNDAIIVVYEGYLTVSESGIYKFGIGVTDNGVLIEIDNKKVAEYWAAGTWYDNNSAGTLYDDKSIELTAGEAYPIKVTYLEIDGGEALQIKVKKDDGEEKAFSEAGFTIYREEPAEVPVEPAEPVYPSNDCIIDTIVTNKEIGPSGDNYGLQFNNLAAGVYKIAYYMTVDSAKDGAQMRISPIVSGEGYSYRCWIDWKTTDEMNGHTGVITFMEANDTNKVILVSVIKVPEDGATIDAGFWQDENAFVGTLDKISLATKGYDFVVDEEYTWVDEKGYRGNDPETTFGEDPEQKILAVEGDWTASTRNTTPPPVAETKDPYVTNNFVDADSNAEGLNMTDNGGTNVGATFNGAWLGFEDFDFGTDGAKSIKIDYTGRLNRIMKDAAVEIWIDGRNAENGGTKVGTISTPETSGEADNWATHAAPEVNLTATVTGVHDVYFVMTGVPEGERVNVANLYTFQFSKTAIDDGEDPGESEDPGKPENPGTEDPDDTDKPGQTGDYAIPVAVFVLIVASAAGIILLKKRTINE